MLEDLAVSATFELQERLTARDGSRPASLVEDVLDSYCPAGDRSAASGFVKCILDDSDLSSVWKSAPRGRKSLVGRAARTESKETAAEGGGKKNKKGKELYGIWHDVPFRIGDYVLVNRGTATRPLFYVAKILYSQGYGDDQKVTVEFGAPNLPNATYPAFTESCLAIVGFVKLSRNSQKTPIAATEDFSEFLYRGGWVAEQALEKWLRGKRFKDARNSIRAGKRKLPKAGAPYDEELEMLFLDEKDRNISEGKHAEDVDKWAALLPSDVRQGLETGLLETSHKTCLESLLDMKTEILDVLPRPRKETRSVWDEDEFRVRIRINRFPDETFVVATQDDKEWDLYKEEMPETTENMLDGYIDVGVDAGTLGQVLEFIEENTL